MCAVDDDGGFDVDVDVGDQDRQDAADDFAAGPFPLGGQQRLVQPRPHRQLRRTDGVSGLNGCSSATYTGPDGSGVSLSGHVSRQRRLAEHGAEPVVQLRRHAADRDRGRPNAARPTRTAGSTRRSSSTSPAPTRRPAVSRVPPSRTRGRTEPARPCPRAAGTRRTTSPTAGSAINYDSTGPSVSGSADRNPMQTGGTTTRSASTSAAATTRPASPAAPVRRRTRAPTEWEPRPEAASDNAGNTGSGSVTIPYDATAPEVTALKPSRAADSNGWFNKPIALTFDGTRRRLRDRVHVADVLQAPTTAPRR